MAYNIEKARASGLTEDKIYQHLSSTGRSPEQIKQIMGILPPVAVNRKVPYENPFTPTMKVDPTAKAQTTYQDVVQPYADIATRRGGEIKNAISGESGGTMAERILHGAAQIPGGLAEAGTTAFERGLSTSAAPVLPLLRKANATITPDIVKRDITRAGQRIGEFAQGNPRKTQSIVDVLDLAAGIPAAGITAPAIGAGAKMGVRGMARGVEGFGGKLESVGKKSMVASMGPKEKMFDSGFDVGNLEKYNIEGYKLKGVEQGLKKRLDVVGKKIDDTIETATKEGRTGDVNELFVKTWDELVTNNANKNEIIPILLKKYNAIANDVPDLSSTPLNLVNRWRKQWAEGGKFNKSVETPALTTNALVHNTLWKNAREVIDNAVPDKPLLKDLNREYHELKPLYSATQRRNQILSRQKSLGITDMQLLGGTTTLGGLSDLILNTGGRGVGSGVLAGLAGVGVKKTLESTPMARLMMKTGGAIKRTPKTLADILQGAY